MRAGEPTALPTRVALTLSTPRTIAKKKRPSSVTHPIDLRKSSGVTPAASAASATE